MKRYWRESPRCKSSNSVDPLLTDLLLNPGCAAAASLRPGEPLRWRLICAHCFDLRALSARLSTGLSTSPPLPSRLLFGLLVALVLPSVQRFTLGTEFFERFIAPITPQMRRETNIRALLLNPEWVFVAGDALVVISALRGRLRLHLMVPSPSEGGAHFGPGPGPTDAATVTARLSPTST